MIACHRRYLGEHMNIHIHACDFRNSAEPVYRCVLEGLHIFSFEDRVFFPFNKLAEVQSAIVEYWKKEIESDYI